MPDEYFGFSTPIDGDFHAALAEHGYNPECMHTLLKILGENNQVIIICDHLTGYKIKIPVEDNVLTWPAERFLEALTEALDDDKMKRDGYI